MLTWRVGTPKVPTCSHTICSGTIPLLSLLLAPFTQCSTALDQSATAILAPSLGNRLAAWFSKVLVSHSPLRNPSLSSVLHARRLSSLDVYLPTSSLILSPPPLPLLHLSIPRPVSPSLSLLATVPALSLDNRKPYLAVCSAQPWQSCQFTCLDCCILYPVSKTYCNYNPRISKCTWYTAMSDQHPVNALFYMVTLPKKKKHRFLNVKAITWSWLLNLCVKEECTLEESKIPGQHLNAWVLVSDYTPFVMLCCALLWNHSRQMWNNLWFIQARATQCHACLLHQIHFCCTEWQCFYILKNCHFNRTVCKVCKTKVFSLFFLCDSIDYESELMGGYERSKPIKWKKNVVRESPNTIMNSWVDLQ